MNLPLKFITLLACAVAVHAQSLPQPVIEHAALAVAPTNIGTTESLSTPQAEGEIERAEISEIGPAGSVAGARGERGERHSVEQHRRRNFVSLSGASKVTVYTRRAPAGLAARFSTPTIFSTMNSITSAAIAILFCAIPSRAAILFDPGFEQPITYDGPPFVGSWEGFSGGAGAGAGNSTLMPRSGVQHLSLLITNSDNNFAGVFQDVPVTAGEAYTFGGFHMTPSSPFDVTTEIRIEWRNASSEISRTANLIPTLTGAYAAFSLDATAPAGAEFARVVYAIQSFTPEPTNTGTVYVDDLSFVPEPSSVTLLAGSALLLVRRGRRAH